MSDCSKAHNHPSSEDWLCFTGTNTPAQVCFIGEVHQPYLEKPGYFGYTVFLKEVPPDVTTKLEQLCAGFAVGSEAPERGRPQQEDGTIRAGINHWECFGITKQQALMDEQVISAQRMGTKAAAIHAEALIRQPDILSDVQSGAYQIVLVGPEFCVPAAFFSPFVSIGDEEWH
jgi:hypothetical protein